MASEKEASFDLRVPVLTIHAKQQKRDKEEKDDGDNDNDDEEEKKAIDGRHTVGGHAVYDEDDDEEEEQNANTERKNTPQEAQQADGDDAEEPTNIHRTGRIVEDARNADAAESDGDADSDEDGKQLKLMRKQQRDGSENEAGFNASDSNDSSRSWSSLVTEHSSDRAFIESSLPSDGSKSWHPSDASPNDELDDEDNDEEATESPLNEDELKLQPPIQDQEVRQQWIVGSRMKIYSDSSKRWFIGSIKEISFDKEGEWLHIEYNQNNIKQIQRFSDYLKPIRRKTSKTAPLMTVPEEPSNNASVRTMQQQTGSEQKEERQPCHSSSSQPFENEETKKKPRKSAKQRETATKRMGPQSGRKRGQSEMLEGLANLSLSPLNEDDDKPKLRRSTRRSSASSKKQRRK